MGKIESEERVVWLRGNSDIDAGCRFTKLPEKIHLDVNEFLDAFETAVKASMKKDVKDKDIQKMKESEQKEREDKAKRSKKKDKERREAVDEDRNEELKLEIQNGWGNLSEETIEVIKTKMEEYEIKSFKDVSEIPTRHLEEIVELMSND